MAFGAKIFISGVTFIPHLHRYIFKIGIALGTKLKTITDYADDVQATLGLPFFQAIQEDKTHISIAASEYDIKENRLLKILGNPIFTNSNMQLPIAIGFDVFGNMCVEDLVSLRHLLVVGPSGTGKSVALKCILTSIIVGRPVSFVNLLVFDIGATSLSQFEDLPHLSHDIVKDIKTGIRVLTALAQEMEERLSHKENELVDEPFIICMIDEFNSIITQIVDKQEAQIFVNLINNLVWRGRKAKIIMILATQDPSSKTTKVDTSTITSRITFQVLKHQNSSSALGITGAEKLPGDGAMLFKFNNNVKYLQGSYVTPQEIDMILDNPPTDYEDGNKFVVRELESTATQRAVAEVFSKKVPAGRDTKELADIILWTLEHNTVSAKSLREHFKMGNRAYDIIDELHSLGIVSGKFSNQPREVIPQSIGELSSEAINILSNNGMLIEVSTDPEDKEERGL